MREMIICNVYFSADIQKRRENGSRMEEQQARPRSSSSSIRFEDREKNNALA
jgi:hypothetical protein